MDKKVLQKYIIKNIPIVRKMKFKILNLEDGPVKISAPFRPHINHQNSVFGGSISGLLILAGWAQVKRIMEKIDPSANIVIQNSIVRYLKPVRKDFTAISQELPQEALDRFNQTFQRFGKAKITASAFLIEENGNENMAAFEGDFVAFRGKE